MMGRYSRRATLPEVGAAGQAKLASARVLVIGAGGLGSPVLAYLAGAGIGCLMVLDSDRVEETNVHRQPLYGGDDVERSKVEAACKRLHNLNPAPRW